MTTTQLRESKTHYWLVPDLARLKKIAIIISPHIIETIIINETGVTHEELIDRVRTLRIVEARHLICYLMQKYTRLSLTKIGEVIGNRHHATVIHGIQVTKNRIDTEPDFKELVKRIEQKII